MGNYTSHDSTTALQSTTNSEKKNPSPQSTRRQSIVAKYSDEDERKQRDFPPQPCVLTDVKLDDIVALIVLCFHLVKTRKAKDQTVYLTLVIAGVNQLTRAAALAYSVCKAILGENSVITVYYANRVNRKRHEGMFDEWTPMSGMQKFPWTDHNPAVYSEIIVLCPVMYFLTQTRYFGYFINKDCPVFMGMGYNTTFRVGSDEDEFEFHGQMVIDLLKHCAERGGRFTFANNFYSYEGKTTGGRLVRTKPVVDSLKKASPLFEKYVLPFGIVDSTNFISDQIWKNGKKLNREEMKEISKEEYRKITSAAIDQSIAGVNDDRETLTMLASEICEGTKKKYMLRRVIQQLTDGIELEVTDGQHMTAFLQHFGDWTACDLYYNEQLKCPTFRPSETGSFTVIRSLVLEDVNNAIGNAVLMGL